MQSLDRARLGEGIVNQVVSARRDMLSRERRRPVKGQHVEHHRKLVATPTSSAGFVTIASPPRRGTIARRLGRVGLLEPAFSSSTRRGCRADAFKLAGVIQKFGVQVETEHFRPKGSGHRNSQLATSAAEVNGPRTRYSGKHSS